MYWNNADLLVHVVRFTPDGSRLLSGDGDGVFRIHDARTARVLQSVSVGSAAILAIDISPDGRWAAIGLQDGIVQLRDLTEKSEPRQLRKGAGEILGVAFSPDGKTLAWGGQNGVTLWNLATQRVVWSGETDRQVNALSFDREGRRLVAGFQHDATGASAVVWNGTTGDRIADLSSGRARDDIVSISFSPDGRRIVAGSGAGLVHVFSTDPYELLVSLELENSVEALAFTPAGDRLITGLWNGDVDVWDIGSDPSVAVEAPGR